MDVIWSSLDSVKESATDVSRHARALQVPFEAPDHALRIDLLPLESELCEEVLERVYTEGQSDTCTVVGLDTEWQPELAVKEDVYLLQLQHLTGSVPLTLKRILVDERFVKVGCNIHCDIGRLQRDYQLEVRGAVDIRDACKAVGLMNLRRGALSTITRKVLGLKLSKEHQISNWGDVHLSDEQLTYAALDAWAAGAILKKLKERGPQGESMADFCGRLILKQRKRAGRTRPVKRRALTASSSLLASASDAGPHHPVRKGFSPQS